VAFVTTADAESVHANEQLCKTWTNVHLVPSGWAGELSPRPLIG